MGNKTLLVALGGRVGVGRGALNNQQSKVLSVLPTVMANSSMASQRGGDQCPGGPDRYFSG